MMMADPACFAALRGTLTQDAPLAPHTSWRAGGRAERLYVPADRNDLAAFVRALPPTEPVMAIGLGSNVLVRDGGVRGTVILMHNPGAMLAVQDGLIYADAGVASPKLARFAAMHGCAEAEFLAGVPGTVGGALAMNAGCYGGETWTYVARVEVLMRDGSFAIRTPADYRIGYRSVAERDDGPPQGIFTAAWFRFPPGDASAARARIRALLATRIASQPLQLPNAGSVFRNPPGDFAARLIESCGLKGCAIGGAQVSPRHANFIVNPGRMAKAADIEALIAHVRAVVRERTGVDLEPEVRIVGVPAPARQCGTGARAMNATPAFGKVAVLLGGASSEREISLLSGNAVLAALHRAGVDAHPFDPAERELWSLKAERFDRAFIALHGRYGEDGTAQGALETLGIPYTGSGVMASALAMDKWRTKLVWQAAGIPTPRYRVVDARTDWMRVVAELGLPLIVKPAREGSTIGISKIAGVDRDELALAYAEAAKHDPLVLVEEFVAGVELTASIVDRAALPLIRIEAPQGNYDYHNKYFSEETKYFCPAGLPDPVEQAIRAQSLDAFDVVGCSGWGRLDLILRADGSWSFLEVNTSPGMTGHSLVPMAARQAGMSFDALCVAILEGAHVG